MLPIADAIVIQDSAFDNAVDIAQQDEVFPVALGLAEETMLVCPLGNHEKDEYRDVLNRFLRAAPVQIDCLVMISEAWTAEGTAALAALEAIRHGCEDISHVHGVKVTLIVTLDYPGEPVRLRTASIVERGEHREVTPHAEPNRFGDLVHGRLRVDWTKREIHNNG